MVNMLSSGLEKTTWHMGSFLFRILTLDKNDLQYQ